MTVTEEVDNFEIRLEEMRFSARSFKIAATMMFLSSMRDQHMSMTQALPDKGTDKKSENLFDINDLVNNMASKGT